MESISWMDQYYGNLIKTVLDFSESDTREEVVRIYTNREHSSQQGIIITMENTEE